MTSEEHVKQARLLLPDQSHSRLRLSLGEGHYGNKVTIEAVGPAFADSFWLQATGRYKERWNNGWLLETQRRVVRNLVDRMEREIKTLKRWLARTKPEAPPECLGCDSLDAGARRACGAFSCPAGAAIYPRQDHGDRPWLPRRG